MFNKACHPLGPALFLKQVEGILASGEPIRPVGVAAIALQVLKHQPESSGEFFRVMQNVDDFGRVTVMFEDHTFAEVIGHDLSISGIRNDLSVVSDFAQYDVRINPSDEIELFMPKASRLYLTRVHVALEGDAWFPAIVLITALGYLESSNPAAPSCSLIIVP